MLLAKTTFEGAVARRVAALVAVASLLTLLALWRPAIALPVATVGAQLISGLQGLTQSLQAALQTLWLFFWTAHPGLLASGVALLCGSAHLAYWRHSRWDRDGKSGYFCPERMSGPRALYVLDQAGTVVAAGTLLLTIAAAAYRARTAAWTDTGIVVVGLAPLIAVLLHKGRMANRVGDGQVDFEGLVIAGVVVAFMIAGASLAFGNGTPGPDTADAAFLGFIGGLLAGAGLCWAVRLPELPLQVVPHDDATA